ncbi:hypothetical protein IFM89_007959 [Coptis chinensis]|uniref:Uncharacterized protein n=1 Tax=Coptis chinensis TaxID=261450 RepID=A0A835IN65_9MAGN|nr:hypothetical protein IFM89_007959 [Coptis chinensis]
MILSVDKSGIGSLDTTMSKDIACSRLLEQAGSLLRWNADNCDEANVWIQAQTFFDEAKRMDASTSSAFYNALTDVLWYFGQVKFGQGSMNETQTMQTVRFETFSGYFWHHV